MACIAKRRGRYVIDFYEMHGKRRWKTLPEGTTKKKAKEILREIEDQLAKGNYVAEKKIPTFSEVSRDWIESMKPELRNTTWSVYEGHIRNHFHEFDPVKINQISTAKVEKYITMRQQKGMNISTLRKILVTLGQIFSYAVRHGYIHNNPFKDARKPRIRKGKCKKNIRILNAEEINTFLAQVKNQKYYTLFKLALMSGARQGELLGLKWSDIDWKNNQIHIQRTFNNQQWFDPKTDYSDRRIDLGPSMMSDLKKWKLACPPNNLNLVFPNNAGKPMNHNNLVNRHFDPAIRKAGIERIRFHNLRHTYASLLIAQGENIKYIQKQLGHSSPTVTLNVYAHLMKPVNQEAACRLEDTVFETTGSKMVAETKKGVTEQTVTP